MINCLTPRLFSPLHEFRQSRMGTTFRFRVSDSSWAVVCILLTFGNYEITRIQRTSFKTYVGSSESNGEWTKPTRHLIACSEIRSPAEPRSDHYGLRVPL